MIKVQYKRGIVRMMDIYGSVNKDKGDRVDIVISSNVIFPKIASSLPFPKGGFLHSYGQTLVIDLDRPEEEIFTDIHKNARYKINRASKRDPIQYYELISPKEDEIRKFLAFFDRFAKYKNLPKGNFGRLKGLSDQDSLIISYVTDESGNVLCYHAYVKADTYCSLLYSASARFDNKQIRNLIGRANRYLHWQDMKSFRKLGIKWFDFGGLFVHTDASDEDSINRFKMEFGGQVVDVDKRIYPLTIIGKMTTFVFWLKMRKRPEFLRAKRFEHKKIHLTNNA
ncbi:peptidoglycan bridge formation glycyltransferase FemA/FemB family protein [Ornithinibacillus scapharcae]|uniref:peptidoglycan bridge formation glycyltransferase FemA/FemB family protein n=1 Tax=Ornithinibacillus scapharcae TaxID=1147159 RepID=UPI000225B2D1|nr:peptidoglycan bridge formation glycyltransferase FemA/FemB family protein [Ornithinibacillus scapharcae]